MVNILHRIGVKGSSPDDVYAALTTLEGLSGWWARDTTGKPGDAGGVIAFRFVPGGFDMKVLELEPGRKVRWEVADGPAEWVGTQVSFELSQAGDFTIVLFEHRGWAEPVEFMYHCSTKWAVFLLSLKQLLEGGHGAPDPDASDVLLGDVVICPQVAAAQAAEAEHDTRDEIDLLCTHGILHLLGYDLADPEDHATMFGLQDRLLASWRAERGSAATQPNPGANGAEGAG